MNKLVLSPHFKKAYKKIVGKNSLLKEQIDSSIKLLEIDLYDARLKTHKLSGELFGCYACSCGYDCRIVFTVEEDNNVQTILLITIGTHDEIY
ncbi:MAG: type II toxin-antitoxin system mRNA interferase toxin, RelE/StbE family [Bacteroidetes bacterium]|nr:type II toxin-antitoxin system mRNA interferase toxin, RelE/StbE family [Bacteroidota bacterium]